MTSTPRIARHPLRIARVARVASALASGPARVLAARVLAALVLAALVATSRAVAQSPTARVVTAANAFVATLTDAQRAKTLYAFDDEKQRARWSNFPTAIVQRAGVKFGDFTVAQRAAALALLQNALSKRGFEKVQQIMDADEALKTSERNNLLFGRDEYYFSILGTPSETAPWMLQFGGHHLALNITVNGTQGTLTPSLTGAQPAMYVANGQTIRPLGQENDKALALLASLDSAQRGKAILNYRVADLVLGPGQDGKVIQPEGLKASGMNDTQKAMLLDLMSEWSGIVHESAADVRMKQLSAEIADTWFAWSGATTAAPGKGGTMYYRIQGPHVVIEYAPQQMGGDPSLHIHSMYRDLTNDYGRKAAGK